MMPQIQSPLSRFQKIKGFILGIFYFTPLLLLMVMVNLTQLFSLVIRPFSPKLFRRIQWVCGYSWWGTASFFMEKIKGIELHYSGDDVPEKENVILTANHQSMVDVPAVFCYALRKKRLGQLKWFAKDILKYVPGPGWGLYIAGNFFVKRNWLRDKSKIQKVFSKVLKDQDPMWLITFLEGTRITPEKLKKSQDFCKKSGRPILKHVLAPRTKGFEAAAQNLRTHIDAIYDLTIVFPEGIPNVFQLFCGYVHKINVHVRRFPVESIPLQEPEIKEWVWKLFQEKDELLEYFIKHKSFPAG